jgi:hypothetical protein
MGRLSLAPRVVYTKGVLLAWISSLLSPPALALGPDVVIQKARQIIIEYRLLTKSELSCSILILEDVISGPVAEVVVRERHDKRCGGDPNTGPRRFTLEINMKTGVARWDYDTPDMEMVPVPSRRGGR